jgi:hypothetical protein
MRSSTLKRFILVHIVGMVHVQKTAGNRQISIKDYLKWVRYRDLFWLGSLVCWSVALQIMLTGELVIFFGELRYFFVIYWVIE